MNRGSSRINWDDIAGNQAKISQYNQRMLNQKQELGHELVPNASSVKTHSYVTHSGVGAGYIGQTAKGKNNKANDQRVQVTLTQAMHGETNTTENRQNFKRQIYDRSANDSHDMIKQLKSTNVAFGYSKQPGIQSPAGPHNDGGLPTKANHEIGQTKEMYSYVKKDAFASNVLPTNENAGRMKPINSSTNQETKSVNQQMFRWNNIKIT